MNTKATLEQLRHLRLYGMAQAYEGVLSLPVQEQPVTNQLIARLAEAEAQYRLYQKTQLFIRLSRLRYNAVLEEVYCNPERNLIKEKLLLLSDGAYIDRAENILITGATGCGKSYLACAFGKQACVLGYKTIYFGMNRFLEKVAQSKIDGTYIKFLNQIEKTNLLILDDFGLYPLDNITRLALLQILEDRYGKKSIIITSQLPINKWHEYIGESTIADAIMDRLSVNAHRFELKGESLRMKKSEKKN